MKTALENFPELLPTAVDLDFLRAVSEVDLLPQAATGTEFLNKIVYKSWGAEYEIFSNDDVSIWCLIFNGFGGMSMHCHRRANTELLVAHGELTVKTLESTHYLSSGEGICLANRRFHQLIGPTGTVILELLEPGLRKDLVRYKDLKSVLLPYDHIYASAATIINDDAHLRQMVIPQHACDGYISKTREDCNEKSVTGLSSAYGSLDSITKITSMNTIRVLGLFRVTGICGNRLSLSLDTLAAEKCRADMYVCIFSYT